MNNLDIRVAMKCNRVFSYEVAEKLGISEFTFCRWLRNELDTERKETIVSAIKAIVDERREQT